MNHETLRIEVAKRVGWEEITEAMKRAKSIKKNYLRVEHHAEGWMIFLVVGEQRYMIGTPWYTRVWAESIAKDLARALDAIVEEYAE